MDNEFNHEILAVEGTDGCGKDYTTKALAYEVVTSDHNIKLVYTSYPNYWYPQGRFIRSMNRGVAEEYAFANHLSFEEELILRGSMYALDRAINQLVVEDLLSPDQLNIQISDRLYFSNVNTLAYLTTRDHSPGETKNTFFKHLPGIVSADIDLMYKTKNKHVILSPQSVDKTFTPSRPELDNLEGKDARDFAIWGYNQIPELFPDIPSFIVNNQLSNGNWRNIDTLTEEIIDQSKIDISRAHKNDPQEIKDQRASSVISPNPFSFFYTFYSEKSLNKLSPYIYKELILNINRIKTFNSINFDENKKKATLDELETKTSDLVDIALNFMPIDKIYLKDKFRNKWQIAQIKRLLTDHTNGNLFPLIRYINERLKYTNGYLRLIESLGEI